MQAAHHTLAVGDRGSGLQRAKKAADQASWEEVDARGDDGNDRLVRSAFGNVPLTTLFPLLSSADADSLNQAAATVDAARFGRGTADWEWALEHAAFPGPRPWTPIILGLDVIEHAHSGDQVEFQLQVVWTDQGSLAVDAMVNVGCWCDADHASHDVDAVRLVVGEDTSLPEAFRSAAERLAGWIAAPHDADYWRAEAGLPPRWTR
ncbi:hypothetical protein ACWGI1_26005 [Streptomyces sp. NPDC054835]